MQLDNPKNLGMFVLSYIMNGYNLSDVSNIKSIAKSIQFEDVKNVAKEVFQKKNRIMKIYSHPKKD